MWLITPSGYLSVVEYYPRAKKGKTKSKNNQDATTLGEDYQAATKETLSSHLLIRARVKADLDALLVFAPDAEVFEDTGADYHYRVIVPRTALKMMMADQIDKIDYDSHFKEVFRDRAPELPKDSRAVGRYNAMSAFWSASALWQPKAPYADAYKSWGSGYSYTSGGGYGGYKFGYKWISGSQDPKTKKWIPGYYVSDSTGEVIDPTKKRWVEGKMVDKKWTPGHFVDIVESDQQPLPITPDGSLDIVDGEIYTPAYGQGGWTDYGSDPWSEDNRDVPEELRNAYPEVAFDPYEENLSKDEFDLAMERFSESTMRYQLRQFLADSGETCDLDEAMRILVEKAGACDLDSVDFALVWEAIEGAQPNRQHTVVQPAQVKVKH